MGLLDSDLSKMSHAELYLLRQKYPDKQNLLAPYEHRAFAREFAQESPIKAAISLPFAIPGYYIYKKVGLGNSRSDPSLDQVIHGYHGLLEGLSSNKGLFSGNQR